VVSKEWLALSLGDAQPILTKIFHPLPPSSLPRQILTPLPDTATPLSTSITGHNFVSARLARILTDVTTARKQDIQGSIDKAQSGRKGSVSNPLLFRYLRFTYHISATVTNSQTQLSTSNMSYESVSVRSAWGHHERDDDQEGVTTMREGETG
jgi:hypothetical protein